jgi:hypothetical protein
MVGSSIRGAPMMRIVGALAGLFAVTGCYVYTPITTGATPQPGQSVAMDITDAGRVALGGSIGPEVAQIEGRVIHNEAESYELAVSTVHLLRGGEQVWQGERVSIRKEFVTRTYQKQLSKGRTAIAGAGGVAVVAWFVTKKIIGSVTGDEGKPPVDPPDSQRRPVRP